MEELRKAMDGIEFRHSKVLLDKIRGAYKDLEEVMENAKESVEVTSCGGPPSANGRRRPCP
jgi:tRNA-splicing ligase RtcB (3'-phosphate/5'-hydroxy nucleic acid ligase)